MPLYYPSILENNNSIYPLIDSNFVKGGGRVVADLTALYALSTYVLQLTERVTRVYVISATAYYILTDITNVGNSSGWTIDSASSPTSYVHTQGSSSATWTITHNLGFYPNVQVIDSAGNNMVGDITYVNTNQITINFSGGFSGTAYLS